ncbi:DnaD/phage-associated family protein [Cytobacillus horneckiae]|uniref:DnaD domain protein n=1 Tax=Cytobacillus horneckiae TaxID=549687 RepID=UPI0019D10C40|nr:DnaD domain protein [Cytobacillus horneckiae]
MQGWIKLHRRILDNDLWHDVTTFRLFTLLLLRATHKDGVKTKSIVLKRGQYLRSYSKLAEDLEFREGRGFKKVSKSTIKRSVQKLIDAGMVTVSETDSGTVFTIVKYQGYQGFDDDTKSINGTDSDTLTERTRNEGGTNPEQEQECKNVRMKENNISTTTELNYGDEYYLCFQSHMNAFQREEINSYLDDGLSDEVICAAFRKAAENGAKYPYAKSIINNWAKKGIKSIDDVEREQQSFMARKQQSKQTKRKGAVRTEMLPEWFEENEKKDKPKLKVVDDTDKKLSQFEQLMEQRKKMNAGS